jgi:hypothetical protein
VEVVTETIEDLISSADVIRSVSAYAGENAAEKATAYVTENTIAYATENASAYAAENTAENASAYASENATAYAGVYAVMLTNTKPDIRETKIIEGNYQLLT